MSAITRILPIDWPDLFKQAGIAPCRCKIAKSKIADAWCLFIEEAGGLQLIEIKPPGLQAGEKSVKIGNGNWVFSA